MSAMVTHKGTFYPWQCDHMGHINVMWYVGKFDEATWPFFAALGITPGYLRSGKSMAAVQQNITYKAELLPGAVVEVRSQVIEVRDRVLVYLHRMVDVEQDRIAAECVLTTVHFDSQTRKACPFPEAIRTAAMGQLGGAA